MYAPPPLLQSLDPPLRGNMSEPVTTQVQEDKSVGGKAMHRHEVW